MRLDVLTIFCVLFKYIIATSAEESFEEDLTFDCGPVIFSDLAVRSAVDEAKDKLIKNFKYPMLYSGNLYDSSLKYRIWPILEDGRIYSSYFARGIFYLVLDPACHVVDIIATLSDNNAAKCKKKSESSLGSFDSNPDNNGYECGDKFIYNDIVLDNFDRARSLINKGFKKLSPYFDNRYNPQFKYLKWPISERAKSGVLEKSSTTPYHIVITENGMFVGVIAKLKLRDSFIECQRGKKIQKTIQMSENDLDFSEESGFQCGVIFFDRKYLQSCTDSASKVYITKESKSYPLSMTGPPFNDNVLIWPIFRNKNIYRNGPSGKFFLVMNQKFEILTVIVKNKREIKQCEERSKYTEIMESENDNFDCDGAIFQAKWLEETANVACRKLQISKLKFPALYNGPAFDVPGPYFTFPLLYQDAGSFRIVINSKCGLAGALCIRNNAFKKCRRLMDGSTPGGELTAEIRELY